MKITVGQINAVLGDLEANFQKITKIIAEAKEEIVVFPLYSTTGFPPKDLLKYDSLWKQLQKNLQAVVQQTSDSDCLVILGTPFVVEEKRQVGCLAIKRGKILGFCGKANLEKYPFFDENIYFTKGTPFLTIDYENEKLFVCVDTDKLEEGPTKSLMINPCVRIYHADCGFEALSFLKKVAAKCNSTVVQVNLAGAQDGLVFDGQSFAVKFDQTYEKAPQFEETIFVVDTDEKFSNNSFSSFEEQIFNALKVGVRDYARKNGFLQAAVGLSGGIDSSLVAVIAVEALGKENVFGILMPSQFTSKESIEDALTLAENLGIKIFTVPIKPIFETFVESLREIVKDDRLTVAEENLQSRIRGTILMTLSNRFGWMILATGNKSEASVGYCTLYGDTVGALEVIGDLYKTDVYKVARWYNENVKKVIPERVFIKPPTAELRPGQYDQEKLPPYDVLDSILRLYIEEGKSKDQIVELGFDEKTVEEVYNMLRTSEYKRKQLPPVIKLSKVTLGYELNLPMSNFFRKL
ncbi:NAD+ synthase [Pseudothermotoga thermarum]|uniref:Glutamine-dependent NAD(+) synthetase n=1 Tax=Pseudothermotoga thermarum DSM 5069 TaxID=688269 RepID=F7YVF3_9THEM|nr:NAD+ synthase [Pseudothermotoga thermarum]AEH50458.1 NAD+ synthetase [Pseudothermotoga thermarum DSM 5069]